MLAGFFLLSSSTLSSGARAHTVLNAAGVERAQSRHALVPYRTFRRDQLCAVRPNA